MFNLGECCYYIYSICIQYSVNCWRLPCCACECAHNESSRLTWLLLNLKKLWRQRFILFHQINVLNKQNVHSMWRLLLYYCVVCSKRPHPRVKVSIAGSLRDREVACSASDRQGSNFESCVLRTVSSQSSHHPQEVLQTQFSLYVHKGGLKPDSFHFAVSERAHLKKTNIYMLNIENALQKIVAKFCFEILEKKICTDLDLFEQTYINYTYWSCYSKISMWITWNIFHCATVNNYDFVC